MNLAVEEEGETPGMQGAGGVSERAGRGPQTKLVCWPGSDGSDFVQPFQCSPFVLQVVNEDAVAPHL